MRQLKNVIKKVFVVHCTTLRCFDDSSVSKRLNITLCLILLVSESCRPTCFYVSVSYFGELNLKIFAAKEFKSSH